MQVTSYHMHSLLECYSRKLSRARRTDEAAPQRGRGEGPLSAEGSREATMGRRAAMYSNSLVGTQILKAGILRQGTIPTEEWVKNSILR